MTISPNQLNLGKNDYETFKSVTQVKIQYSPVTIWNCGISFHQWYFPSNLVVFSYLCAFSLDSNLVVFQIKMKWCHFPLQKKLTRASVSRGKSHFPSFILEQKLLNQTPFFLLRVSLSHQGWRSALKKKVAKTASTNVVYLSPSPSNRHKHIFFFFMFRKQTGEENVNHAVKQQNALNVVIYSCWLDNSKKNWRRQKRKTNGKSAHLLVNFFKFKAVGFVSEYEETPCRYQDPSQERRRTLNFVFLLLNIQINSQNQSFSL